jgi:GntR family transcriptional regulator
MMPEGFFTLPLYLQLRDALAERIARGEWKPGTAIPGEGDLARELGVSKGTMRKALDLLESEHLLSRRQGRGTFVTDPGSQDLAQRFNNFRLANGAAAGGEASTRDIVVAEASDSECAHLQLVPGEQVYRISRVRLHQSKAFMIEAASLPAALFPQLLERALRSHRLVEIAQAYSLLLGNSEERISVGTCSPLAVEALNLIQGTYVLMLDRIIRTRNGRPVEWRRAECVLNGVHYQVDLG